MSSVGFYSFLLPQKSDYFLSSFGNVRRRYQLSINFPLLESKESKGKHVNQEAYRIHRLETSSCFHDFLNLKASCFEACYRFSIQFCLHLLALKAFLYTQVMLRWYSQIFAKALKITSLATRILTA